MRVEAEIETAAGPVRVVLAGREGPRIQGKFVFGRCRSGGGMRILVFDDSAPFHKDIAAAYGVQVSGGGWMTIDHPGRTVQVSGHSTQFGREADRGLTLDLLQQALPGYRVWAD